MALKKRIIFELLYKQGSFLQSRNFRLQKVGGLDWLLNAYDISKLSKSVDEIVITDLSDKGEGKEAFYNAVTSIVETVRIPVCLGGGVSSLNDAEALLSVGADKIIVNSLFYENINELKSISTKFGKQFLIFSLDWAAISADSYYAKKSQGQEFASDVSALPWHTIANLFGEVMLKSIERDGTGNGLMMQSVDFIPKELGMPIILSGGVGKTEHFIEGLKDPRVSAVATANLLNFIGDTMSNCRREVALHGIPLADFTV